MTKHAINITLAILSGVIGFLAFPPVAFSYLAWIFLAPLLVAVRSCGAKEALLYSYISGIVFFAGLLYWLINVSVPGYITLVLYMAVYFALFGAAANLIFRKCMDIMAIPFLWVVLEYVRAHLFTGFPWGLLAYAQYKNLTMIQISDITGAYGVSFLVAAFNTAFFSVLVRSRRKVHYAITALVLVVVATIYGAGRVNNSDIWGGVRLSVVQGNIPQEEKWEGSYSEDILKIYSDLTARAASSKPDMIIWPESSYPYLVDRAGGVPEDLKLIATQADTPLLVGIVDSEKARTYNSAYLLTRKGELAGIYSKLHLVPWGEYIPYEEKIFFIRGMIDKPIGDFAPGNKETLLPLKVSRAQTTGDAVSRSTTFYKFGTLVCFEDVFPYISRELVMSGADFLVNITNDAWFGPTAAAEQHLQASVFRAVENKVPVIRCANTGVSCFIDASGEILSRVQDNGKDTFVRGIAANEVSVRRGKTYYCMKGDHFVLLSAAVLVLFLLIRFFFARNLKNDPPWSI